jgi:hypothetical protein
LEELREQTLALGHDRPDALLISAEKGWGLDELLAQVEAVLQERAEVLSTPESRWAGPEPRPADMGRGG